MPIVAENEYGMPIASMAFQPQAISSPAPLHQDRDLFTSLFNNSFDFNSAMSSSAATSNDVASFIAPIDAVMTPESTTHVSDVMIIEDTILQAAAASLQTPAIAIPEPAEPIVESFALSVAVEVAPEPLVITEPVALITDDLAVEEEKKMDFAAEQKEQIAESVRDLSITRGCKQGF